MIPRLGWLLALLATASCAQAQDNGALVAQGRAAFQEQGCYGCHTVGATGTPIAPDLARIGAKYDETQLTRWLADPSAQRPSAHMPKLRLSGAELRALAAYLGSLR